MSFAIYDHANTPAITTNRFTASLQDSRGDLRFGAQRGELVRRRGETFERVPLTFTQDTIAGLAEDHDGANWVAARDGIARIHGGQVERVPLPCCKHFTAVSV